MRTILLISTFSLVSTTVGQPAEFEVQGIFGECIPVYAATQDELHLYKDANLNSMQLTIPFRDGWKIEAPKKEGKTRVLERGQLRVSSQDPSMYCSVEPNTGPVALVEGEIVDYLFYRGEGFGEIQFRGAMCAARVYEDFGHFEILGYPDVQVWLKIFNADGTSPGWLFHDNSQTRPVDVQC